MSIFAQLGIKGGKERLHEETLYNLAACYALAEKKVADELEPFGLSPVTMNALLAVKHIGGKQGISQSDIGKRLVVTAGNITRLLDRLEKQKWVLRRPSDRDRRIKKIFITESGSKLLAQAWPHYIRRVREIVSMLPKPEIQTTVRVLDQFRQCLSQ